MPTEVARRPNLFLVGAQKSGTTTLALMLSSHPRVFMSSPKEPGFLAFGERGYTGRDGHGRIAHARSWVVRSEGEYLDLFRDAPSQARWLGEASTWYLSEPHVAERLADFSPDARIIVIFRQPADRAYSAWCHARRDGEEPCEDFASALAMECERSSSSHLLRYREMSEYARQLRRYLEVFGQNRVLPLFYEDLRDDPDGLWQRCCSFLELDPRHCRPPSYRQNRSGEPRSRLLHGLMRSERFKRAVKALLPVRVTALAKNRLESLNLRSFPPIEPGIRRSLTLELSEEIHDLMRLTGRDLRHWLPND
jgi:hypothetical protein